MGYRLTYLILWELLSIITCYKYYFAIYYMRMN